MIQIGNMVAQFMDMTTQIEYMVAQFVDTMTQIVYGGTVLGYHDSNWDMIALLGDVTSRIT
jgi:hypothetical protein